jgi:hypothetical protein
MGGPLIIIAFLIVAAIAGVYSTIAARKRREELFELAQRLNLNFNPEPDQGLAEQYQFLKKLAHGDNRYAYNVLSGKYRNDDIQAFDYHYQVTTSDGKGSHTTHYRFSFFILQFPAFFPDLTIRRENFFLKVAEAFGYQDIKFESAEFSKAFNVRSADKKFAYDVCNGKMMEYLLANRDLSIEIENQALALAFDSCLSAAQIEFNLQRLAQIRSLMPEYLFTQTA